MNWTRSGAARATPISIPCVTRRARPASPKTAPVFHGYPPAGIDGIFEASAAQSLSIPANYEAYPDVVAEATHRLRSEGVSGPYGIALGPRCYTGLTRSTDRGYPVINHVRELLDGPIVWAPAADGAVVMSLRGGDFELTVGQDFSVGYLDHTSTSVLLYLQETFTFRVLTPRRRCRLHIRRPTRRCRTDFQPDSSSRFIKVTPPLSSRRCGQTETSTGGTGS